MGERFNDFVDEAKKYACGIYKNFPGALVPNPSDAGYKSIWDDLCYEAPPGILPGLPPKPVPPFLGGQCCDGYYYVDYTNFFPGISGDGKRTSRELLGKILGIRITQNPGFRVFEIEYQRCNGTKLYESALSSGDPQATVTINAVRPSRGQGDTCGNLPKKFPPSPPVPVGGYTSPPTIIISDDGDENNYTFNFYPPRKEDFPDTPFPPIVINVDGVNVDLNFDITFNFGGGVNVSVPGGGDAGLSPALAGEFKNLSDKLSAVGAATSDIKENVDFSFFPPFFPTAPNVQKEVKPVAAGEQEDNKEGLLGVYVELTELGKEVIFGTPNITFAGWLTFKLQGGYVPREPIHFEQGYFPAPSGSTGYALTFTKGAKGTITVFSKVAE